MVPKQLRDRYNRVAKPERYLRIPSRATFKSDGLITAHNCDFINDPQFHAAYAAGERTGSWKGANVAWRAHVACWAAAQAMHHDGDFVECGVYRGGLARTVCEYVQFRQTKRTFFLLDTFRGLVAEQITSKEAKLGITPTRDGYYEECYDDVVETFRDFPNVKVIRGAVPGTLSQVTAQRVAYLSIDMNCVEPEIAAAAFFWDKLVSGALIVLDDYGWTEHIHQKRAFDEFAKQRGVQVLSMPTGQGLILKP